MSLVHRKLRRKGKTVEELMESYVEMMEGRVVRKWVGVKGETFEEGMKRLEVWREKQEERERLKGADGVERWVKE